MKIEVPKKPKIRKENGKTLIDVVLTKGIDAKPAHRIADFCSQNKVVASLVQNGRNIRKVHEYGNCRAVPHPESYDCSFPTEIFSRGEFTSDRDYLLRVDGDDEQAEINAKTIYYMLPTK